MMPALGLGSEKAEPGIMDKPPRARDAHLMNRTVLWKAFAWYGLIASIISSGAYFFVNHLNGWPLRGLATSGSTYVMATTMTLAAIIFCQIAAAMNCRTENASVFKVGLFTNHLVWFGIGFEIFLLALLSYTPFLQNLFHTGPLALTDWLFLAIIPIPLFLIEEGRKWLNRRRLSREKVTATARASSVTR